MNFRRQKPCLVYVASRGFLSALLLTLTATGVAPAAEKPHSAPTVSSNVSLVPVVGAAKAELLRSLGGARSGTGRMSPDHHECPGGSPHVQGITCGSTTNDQLTMDGSCPLQDSSYVDLYSFEGTSGQQVTISMSAAYDTFLFLLDPAAMTATTDHGGGGGNTSRIVFTLTSTGTWFIAANSFAANQFGAYTLTLTCGVAPPSLDAAAIIPVVGSTAGAAGAFFRSSVQLYNPRAARMTGRLVYHPAGSSATSTDPSLAYVLEPSETRSIPDLLPAMGLTGLGSLDVVPDTGTATPLLVVRVFNDAGAAGTTGFTEEGVAPAEALVAGELGFLIAPPDPDLYRFNVGVRTLVSGATLTITARNAAGTVTRTLTRTYLPNYFEQRDSASFLNGAAAAANESFAVQVVSGSAIVYGATVDNRTNDPSLQLANQAP
jgi:hypothetical protein